MTAAPRAAGLAVEWAGVSFAYEAGADVVRAVSLSIAAGESVVLAGPNGAGKTTLTRMAMGLVRPRAGRVTVGDWDVSARRPDEMAARVGYAFQHADQQLFARTVGEDVAFGPRQLGRSAAEATVLVTLAAGRNYHARWNGKPVSKHAAASGTLQIRLPRDAGRGRLQVESA